jgi:ABC-type branched-subunit amino acid transport system substrate-binding protein
MGDQRSRRQALRTTAAILAGGLAGCSFSDDQARPTSDHSPTRTTEAPAPTTETTTTARPTLDAVALFVFPKTGAQVLEDYYLERTGDEETILVSEYLQDERVPKQVDEDLSNVYGTARRLTGPNYDAFARRYRNSYGTEPDEAATAAFDAAACLLLANAAAGANDGPAIRDQMRRVTRPPGASVGPDALAEGVRRAARGEQVHYVGAATATQFDERGDPASATYERWQYDATASGGTESFETVHYATSPGGRAAASAPGGTERTLKLGLLRAPTGPLAEFGTKLERATQLATDVVDAGAPVDVDLEIGDTRVEGDQSSEAAQALIDDGYASIVGPAMTTIAERVARDVLIPNQVVACLPTPGSVYLSVLDDDGFVFQTSPTELLEAELMAKIAAEEFAATTTATMFNRIGPPHRISQQYAETFRDTFDGAVWDERAIPKQTGAYRDVWEELLRTSS